MSVTCVPVPHETTRLYTNKCVLKPRGSQKHCWVNAEATLKAFEKVKYTGNESSLKSGLEAAPAQQEGCNLHVQMLPAVEVVSYTSKEKIFATSRHY